MEKIFFHIMVGLTRTHAHASVVSGRPPSLRGREGGREGGERWKGGRGGAGVSKIGACVAHVLRILWWKANDEVHH